MTESTSNYRRLWLPDLIWIGLLATVATVPFLTSALDLRILSVFHHPGADHPWPHEFDRVWRALYMVGTWPALLTALAGLGLLVAALYRPLVARWRRQAALVFLTLVLGPGLFVNTLFKDHWGRPRPRQVTELGGTMNYQCFYEKGTPGRGKSFPCGHSSMGYYFVVFYFLARRRRPVLAITALAGALVYGTLIGIARMAAGAHFASDVLWSAVIPAAVAWLLYYVVLRIPWHEDHPDEVNAPSWWRSPLLVWGAPPLAVAAIAAVLLGTPAFTEMRYDLECPGTAAPTVRLVVERCRVSLNPRANLHSRIMIRGEARGFGWPWSRLRHSASWSDAGGVPVLEFTFKPKGHFSELDGQVTIDIPLGTIVTGTPPP